MGQRNHIDDSAAMRQARECIAAMERETKRLLNQVGDVDAHIEPIRRLLAVRQQRPGVN